MLLSYLLSAFRRVAHSSLSINRLSQRQLRTGRVVLIGGPLRRLLQPSLQILAIEPDNTGELRGIVDDEGAGPEFHDALQAELAKDAVHVDRRQTKRVA